METESTPMAAVVETLDAVGSSGARVDVLSGTVRALDDWDDPVTGGTDVSGITPNWSSRAARNTGSERTAPSGGSAVNSGLSGEGGMLANSGLRGE
jgi:hypothetical protein